MNSWDEIRTAYQVAKHGTVSGAATALGVHHATVIRHIDALEGQLGVKLFQRHARGYTPTEAGQDLLQVAGTTDDQFTQMVGRLKGKGDAMVGDLIVTTINELTPLISPVLVAFRAKHPGLTVRLLTGERLFRLEYGEAHVAIRAGSVPQEPDNVVQSFGRIYGAYYASKTYVRHHGIPRDETDIAKHVFVGHDSDAARAPFDVWMRTNIPREQVIFRAAEQNTIKVAVKGGAGIGYLPLYEGQADPDLREVWPAREEWSAPLWLVTHVDLHRTAKVQRFTEQLKKAARDWPTS
ncbi:MAG: LysR family transcriptional regulator [Pseudomonadota bacterium]